jgi:hypothetical protein
MPIERYKPPRPCFVKHLVATQLMIDPGQHDPKLLGWDQTKDIPNSVSAWLVWTHETIQSLGRAQFGFDGIEAPPVQGKQEEGAAPNR